MKADIKNQDKFWDSSFNVFSEVPITNSSSIDQWVYVREKYFSQFSSFFYMFYTRFLFIPIYDL